MRQNVHEMASKSIGETMLENVAFIVQVVRNTKFVVTRAQEPVRISPPKTNARNNALKDVTVQRVKHLMKMVNVFL